MRLGISEFADGTLSPTWNKSGYENPPLSAAIASSGPMGQEQL